MQMSSLFVDILQPHIQVVLKYNHYHDAERGKQKDVLGLFKDIVETIDFEEDNSLFWIFADHGEPQGITTNHNPPDSFLSWVSITDNITNQKITKNISKLRQFPTINSIILSINTSIVTSEK